MMPGLWIEAVGSPPLPTVALGKAQAPEDPTLVSLVPLPPLSPSQAVVSVIQEDLSASSRKPSGDSNQWKRWLGSVGWGALVGKG